MNDPIAVGGALCESPPYTRLTSKRTCNFQTDFYKQKIDNQSIQIII